MSEDRVLIDGKWLTEAEAIEADQPVITREEFEDLKKKVDEIHGFISGVAGALNNPMVKSMLPPNMRGLLGG